MSLRRAILVPLMLMVIAAGPGDDTRPPADPDLLQMDAQQRKTVSLQTAAVAMQPIVGALVVPGTIALDPAMTAHLRPVGDARVVRLLVQPGDRVQAGAVLADLFSSQIAQAQGSVATLQAQTREAVDAVAVARDALRRAELLARDGSLAWAEVSRRRLLVEQAEAQAATVRAQRASLAAELSGLGAGGGSTDASGVAHLTTPIAGVVAEVNVTNGALAGPSAPNDAFVVADLSGVIALAQVAEADAMRVRSGAQAEIAIGSGASGQRSSGTVIATGAMIDPGSRTLPVRIRVPNPDGRLRGGMSASVTLFEATGVQGLVVPPAAIQLVGGDHIVFTDEGGGNYRRHTVRLGVERSEWVEVRNGLEAGQRVVTNGSFALKTVLQKSMLGGS